MRTFWDNVARIALAMDEVIEAADSHGYELDNPVTDLNINAVNGGHELSAYLYVGYVVNDDASELLDMGAECIIVPSAGNGMDTLTDLFCKRADAIVRAIGRIDWHEVGENQRQAAKERHEERMAEHCV